MVRKINIICPICSKFKRIPIPPEIFEIEEGSLLKLPIEEGVVCSHRFLALIDFHFSVRDYEVPCAENNYLEDYFAKLEEIRRNNRVVNFTF